MAPNPFPLRNRTALVTGSSTGLGKAVAFALGRAGARVAFNYQNNLDRAAAAFDEYRAESLEGGLFRGNVTDEVEVNNLVRDVTQQLGPIDILVLNATPAQPQKPIEEYSWSFYQEMLDFFIKSPFLLTRACLPSMKERKHGRIINIGSEVFRRGVGNFSAYVAAKGGQAGWTRSMSTELAPFGITVNLVSPGWIPVERHANDPQEDKDAYRRLIPANRWGVPEDVANTVLFLAGDASGFITGADLAVNGGLTPG